MMLNPINFWTVQFCVVVGGIISISTVHATRKTFLKEKQPILLINTILGVLICIEAEVFEFTALNAFGYSIIMTTLLNRAYRFWKESEMWFWYIQLGILNIPGLVYAIIGAPNYEIVILASTIIVGLIVILLIMMKSREHDERMMSLMLFGYLTVFSIIDITREISYPSWYFRYLPVWGFPLMIIKN